MNAIQIIQLNNDKISEEYFKLTNKDKIDFSLFCLLSFNYMYDDLNLKKSNNQDKIIFITNIIFNDILFEDIFYEFINKTTIDLSFKPLINNLNNYIFSNRIFIKILGHKNFNKLKSIEYTLLLNQFNKTYTESEKKEIIDIMTIKEIHLKSLELKRSFFNNIGYYYYLLSLKKLQNDNRDKEKKMDEHYFIFFKEIFNKINEEEQKKFILLNFFLTKTNYIRIIPLLNKNYFFYFFNNFENKNFIKDIIKLSKIKNSDLFLIEIETFLEIKNF